MTADQTSPSDRFRELIHKADAVAWLLAENMKQEQSSPDANLDDRWRQAASVVSGMLEEINDTAYGRRIIVASFEDAIPQEKE